MDVDLLIGSGWQPTYVGAPVWSAGRTWGGNRHSDKEIFRSDLNQPKSCKMSERLLNALRKFPTSKLALSRGFRQSAISLWAIYVAMVARL